ncbi:hypothetical protein [Albibacterium indicum]|uniref:hypothetical protein n=1 Tax=Albibacterium indicum TaxID=2292082 RepID=UPI000E52C31F|nr:hypothetical protein [Pedobacter indicus]
MKYPYIVLIACFCFLMTGCYERPASTENQVSEESSAAIAENDLAADVSPDTNEQAEKSDSEKPTKVALYIENSGSMNGYVTGNTEFKNAIGDLLVLLKFHYGEENIRLYFINDQIHPIEGVSDLTKFASWLSPATMKVGNTASSDLNLVFKEVLENTDNQTLSLLFSDLIYSIQGSNTEELLNYQKSQTKDAFLSKSKSGVELQTSIIQYNSSFNGGYWDKNNQRVELKGAKRPYYLTVTGEADRVLDLNKNINLKVKGFVNQLTLTTDDFSENNYYSVLTSTHNNGRFKPIRSMSSGKYVRGIEDVTVNERSSAPFSFAVAVDLSKMPVEESYKLDTANYEVLEGNYMIDSIMKIEQDDIHSTDWIRIQEAKATHLFLFDAQGKAFSDLTFAMKKQIPSWVYHTDSEDDTSVEGREAKTFGFKYLVEGVSEAYETVAQNKDHYFEIKVPVRKATASNTGKIFVVLVLLAVIGGLVYTYLKRRK